MHEIYRGEKCIARRGQFSVIIGRYLAIDCASIGARTAASFFFFTEISSLFRLFATTVIHMYMYISFCRLECSGKNTQYTERTERVSFFCEISSLVKRFHRNRQYSKILEKFCVFCVVQMWNSSNWNARLFFVMCKQAFLIFLKLLWYFY